MCREAEMLGGALVKACKAIQKPVAVWGLCSQCRLIKLLLHLGTQCCTFYCSSYARAITAYYVLVGALLCSHREDSRDYRVLLFQSMQVGQLLLLHPQLVQGICGVQVEAQQVKLQRDSRRDL